MLTYAAYNAIINIYSVCEEVDLMKWNKIFIYRFAALFVAFLFIPMLLCGSNSGDKEDNPLSPKYSGFNISMQEICQPSAIACAEELFQSGGLRISRCGSVKRTNLPKCLDYYFNRILEFLTAAGVIYINTIFLMCGFACSRRFIIRYIHHQDGYRISPSFYC